MVVDVPVEPELVLLLWSQKQCKNLHQAMEGKISISLGHLKKTMNQTNAITMRTRNSFIILNKQFILESPLVVFRISFHFSFLHTIEQHVDTHYQIESKNT